MNHTFEVTEYTRDDGLKLHGSALGWMITRTGYGPVRIYKDGWILSRSGLTPDQIYYKTLEDAKEAFLTVEFPIATE